MLSSTLQAFLLVCSYTSLPVQPASLPEQPAKQTDVLVAGQPAKQTDVLVGEEPAKQTEALEAKQPAKQTGVLVAEPTTNGAKKPMGDPLAMMPESRTDAGDKARLWLKDNQMVIRHLL